MGSLVLLTETCSIGTINDKLKEKQKKTVFFYNNYQSWKTNEQKTNTSNEIPLMRFAIMQMRHAAVETD